MQLSIMNLIQFQLLKHHAFVTEIRPYEFKTCVLETIKVYQISANQSNKKLILKESSRASVPQEIIIDSNRVM